MTRVFELVLGAIGGIALVVGGIGIMHVLLAGVAERTREIGVRKAVGATRGGVLAQFLVESVLITAAGAALGFAAAFAVSALVRAMGGGPRCT